MTATEPRDVVFLHSATGLESTAAWLGPLNVRLAQMGYSRFDPDFDRITSPDYLDELLGGECGSEPARTWTKRGDADYEQSKLRYLLYRDELCRAGRAWERTWTGPTASFVSDNGWMTRVGARFLKPVRQYEHNKDCRWAAQRAVLNQLPKSGSIILIAHSLGSVLALDLLTKLPPDLNVDLLLTIGSPLAIRHLGWPGFDPNHEFPYDRVGGWVNLYDSWDLVTIGRGVGGRFAAACDISVFTDTAHDSAA